MEMWARRGKGYRKNDVDTKRPTRETANHRKPDRQETKKASEERKGRVNKPGRIIKGKIPTEIAARSGRTQKIQQIRRKKTLIRPGNPSRTLPRLRRKFYETCGELG